MAASAVSFVMMVASECFLPSIIVAVKFFNFVKFAVFYHAYQLFQAFCAFYPKAGNIGRCVGCKQGGLLVVPSNPVAVLRLYEYGIGMDGFVFGIDQHSGSDIGLKR